MRYVLMACVMLAGCAQMRENLRRAEEREAAQLAAADDATCRSYGINFGTPQYAQCRMLVAQQRAQAADAQQQRGLMMMGLGAGMMQTPQPAPRPAPTMTDCYRAGAIVQCRSY